MLATDIVELDDAIKMAEEQELDLVEISPKADPPVCRILNYQKFLYDQKKKQKEIKANQAKVTQKEIRFGPNTDDHDFNFKVKHARKFLRGQQAQGARLLSRKEHRLQGAGRNPVAAFRAGAGGCGHGGADAETGREADVHHAPTEKVNPGEGFRLNHHIRTTCRR